jgi:hypothetical protein
MVIVDDNTQTITLRNEASGVGAIHRQKDFTLHKDCVILIGIKIGLALDDEEESLVFVDRHQKCYFLNRQHFGVESWAPIGQMFGLDLDTSKFTENEYGFGSSFILYPNAYKGKPLYNKWYTSVKAAWIAFSKFLGNNWAKGAFSSASKEVINRSKI